MKLKTIKKKIDEKYSRSYYCKLLKELKRIVNLPNKMIFYLGIRTDHEVFLCDNKIYIIKTKRNDDYYNFDEIVYLKTITLLKNEIKTSDDFISEILINQIDIDYTDDKFLLFLQKPCDITEKIDFPFLEIINFFRNYKYTQFKSDNFIFYPKYCNDKIYIDSIFAKNIKNGNIMRLYITDCWYEIPDKLQSYAVEAITKNIPYSEKLKCKKEFIKFSNKYNEEFQIENFWVMNLLINAVNTMFSFDGWVIHRIFAGFNNKFSNIWCDDFLGFDKKPYFFLTDNPYSWEVNKIAVLDFKEPKYKTKGIYKQNWIKFMRWELTKDYIQELMQYLQQPFDKKSYCYDKEPEIKTNWQKLIYEYNTNTVGYDYEDGTSREDYEVLPLDLPMPDYLKLLEEKC